MAAKIISIIHKRVSEMIPQTGKRDSVHAHGSVAKGIGGFIFKNIPVKCVCMCAEVEVCIH